MKVSKPASVSFLTLFLVTLLGLSGLGQNLSTGSITGVVRDESGGVVPGVEVLLVHQQTGLSRRVLTNESGSFTAESLPRGTFTVTVENPGFKTAVLTNQELSADERLDLDIRMAVGEISESVTVSDTSPVLQSASAAITGDVTSEQLSELPIRDRNFALLGALGAGVVAVSSDSRGFGQEGNPDLSVQGSRLGKVRYSMDGIQNMDTGGQEGVNNFPPPETVQEVKFLKANYGADTGTYGVATMNIVTKSGSRDFHGSLYYFHRNDALDARNFFAADVSPLRLHQYGFTLGGPFFIPGLYNQGRTKDFFFYSESIYERHGGHSMLSPALIRANTPTAEMRAGDFGGLAAIKDPLTKQPFADNVIPLERIDPNARLLFEFWPLPTNPGASFNYQYTPYLPTNWHEELIRWDHYFSETTQVMVRYVQDDWEQEQARAGSTYATIGMNFRKPGKNLVTSLTNVFSSSLLNQFSFGYSANHVNKDLIGEATRPAGLNIKEVFPSNEGNKIPTINLTKGWGSIGVGDLPYWTRNPVYVYRDDLSKVMGNHSLKFGFEIMDMSTESFYQRNEQGTFTFNGNATGHPVADFLLGRAQSYGEGLGGLENLRHFNSKRWDFYVQDHWKIHPNFKFNYGVRYSIFQGGQYGREKKGLLPSFNPAVWDPAMAPELTANGNFLVPGTGNPYNGVMTPEGVADTFRACGVDAAGGCDMYITEFDNIGPRLGFAWSPDEKWVIRGGGGIYHGPGRVIDDNRIFDVPFGRSASFFGDPTLGDLMLSDPTGGTLDTSLPVVNGAGRDPQGRAFENYQWSLGIQRELFKETLMEVAYVANRSVHQNIKRQINLPTPEDRGTGNINFFRPMRGRSNTRYVEPAGRAEYHSMQLHMNRRFAQGFMLEASYTWSKALGHLNDPYTDVQNPRRIDLEWGPVNFDRPHVFASNFLYELPFGRTSQNFFAKVFGGWQLGGIVSFQSGPSVSIGAPDRVNMPGTRRASVVSGQDPNAGPKTVDEWFNTAAFRIPDAGTYGDAGPGTVRFPGINNWDLTLVKNTHIPWVTAEGARFQIRASFFNAFNHTQWSGVAASVDNTRYGAVTGAHDPRIIELALRIIY